jgi:type II secretory pathway pseudopilin PulG
MKMQITDSMRKGRHQSGRGAFVLLEALMAMALFAIIAVGLTQALHMTAESAKEIRMEVQILRKMESFLTQSAKALEFEDSEGSQTLEVEKFGDKEIYYSLAIEPMEDLENLEGQLLERMWRITVQADWVERNGDQMKEVAETYRYEPMYQNNR